jgi:hypothetical protein
MTTPGTWVASGAAAGAAGEEGVVFEVDAVRGAPGREPAWGAAPRGAVEGCASAGAGGASTLPPGDASRCEDASAPFSGGETRARSSRRGEIEGEDEVEGDPRAGDAVEASDVPSGARAERRARPNPSAIAATAASARTALASRLTGALPGLRSVVLRTRPREYRVAAANTKSAAPARLDLARIARAGRRSGLRPRLRFFLEYGPLAFVSWIATIRIVSTQNDEIKGAVDS